MESALLKSKPIFNKLNETEIVNWIENESMGYEDMNLVPSYRKLKGELYAVYNNLYGGKMKVQVHISNATEEMAKIFSTVPLNDSISSIEDLVIDAEDFICYQYNSYGSKDLAKQLNLDTDSLLRLEHKIAVSELKKIIYRTKSKLLDNLDRINRDYTDQTAHDENDIEQLKKEDIFIIHGHDKVALLELKDLLKTKFNLHPMVLADLPTTGTTTIIEKFERYANKCKLAIGLLTPDDLITKNNNTYYQPRPNVIFELGWFISKLGRNNVLLIVKEKTEIFSDLQGVLNEMVFKNSITEIYYKLEQELAAQELVTASEGADLNNIATIKREKDINNIRKCMSYINIEKFDLFLLQAPKFVLKDIFIFHAAFTDVFESNNTYFHDKRLKKHFRDFYRLWDLCLNYGHFYNTGNNDYYSFDIPGDLFKDEVSEKCFNMLTRSNIRLSESFKELLNYIRECYPEIDLNQLSQNALSSFYNFEIDN